MKPKFTNSGIEIQTFSEIFGELADQYRSIYGQKINLDQNSPSGQRVGIEAKLQQDLQQFLLYLSQNFDPEQADEIGLVMLGKLVGITRQLGTRSQWDLRVEVTKNLVLPKGYKVKDEREQAWITDSDHNLQAGINTVTFYSEDFGEVKAYSTDTIEIATIVNGVVAITANQDATVGKDEETLEAFRVRRLQSLQSGSKSMVGSLTSELWKLPNVTDVKVYDNPTKNHDPAKDMESNSLWVICEGGDASEIVKLIVMHKAGNPTKGEIEATYLETIPIPKKNINLYLTHKEKFDRPKLKEIEIKITLTKKDPLSPIDDELIKQNLSELTFLIGDKLQAGELYPTVYKSGSTFIVNKIEIRSDGGWTDGQIEPYFDEKFVIKPENIEVIDD